MKLKKICALLSSFVLFATPVQALASEADIVAEQNAGYQAISPRYVVYKSKTIKIPVTSVEAADDYYYYSEFDTEYGVTMRGDLELQGVNKDSSGRWIATYKGDLIGYVNDL